MIEADARDLIKWMIRWKDNAVGNYEFNDIEIAITAKHFFAGIDPWKSVAAIQAGIDLPLKRR